MPAEIRVTEIAESDIEEAVIWTKEHFGVEQAFRYSELIWSAIGALAETPNHPLGRTRRGLQENARFLPVARAGRPARHWVLYRLLADDVIEIGRVLHESRDMDRHLPDEYKD